jgi:hypothetical protein
MGRWTPERISEAQRYVCRRRDREGRPNCYYWIAVWLELEAKRGYDHKPIDSDLTSADLSLKYASSQRRLFWDMKARPRHYARKPKYLCGNEVSDWQWSGLLGWEKFNGRLPKVRARRPPFARKLTRRSHAGSRAVRMLRSVLRDAARVSNTSMTERGNP